MGSLLVDGWLHGRSAVELFDEASVSMVREEVRAAGAAQGLSTEQTEALVTAASELGHNQLRHGGPPRMMAITPVSRDGVAGVEVVAADGGSGIAEATRAFSGGAGSSSAGGLGIGLAGVSRLTDELDVDIRRGEGTAVWVRKFAGPVARARQVAVVGRPCDGYRVSGDSALFLRTDEGLLLAAADGLGHGAEARQAAAEALAVVRAAAGAPPDAVISRCATELNTTRGCVLAVARISRLGGTIDHSIVGDIKGIIVSPQNHRKMRSARGFLGRGAGRVSPVTQRDSVDIGDLICLHTDGISQQLTLSSPPDLMARSALAIAEHILDHYSKNHDDALVLVAR